MNEFRKFRNKVNAAIKKEKASYYQEKFSGAINGLRRIWEDVNEPTNRKKSANIIQEIRIREQWLCGSELTDMLNSFFVNIEHDREEQDRQEYNVFDSLRKKINPVMHDPTTPDDVEKCIKKLRNIAAADDDDLKSSQKKIRKSIISFPFSHIINKILQTRIFPDELKVAKVTAVYKGGAKRIKVVLNEH